METTCLDDPEDGWNPWESGALVTLSDMLRFHGKRWLLGRRLMRRIGRKLAKEPARTYSSDTAQYFVGLVDTLEKACREVGFDGPVVFIQTRFRPAIRAGLTSGRFGELLRGLDERIEEEMMSAVMFRITKNQERLFRAKDLFGEAVSQAYPSAIADVAEAGRCLALDRYPACVFHLMRVAEKALRVIATELSVPLATLKKGRSWGGVIYDVNEKLRAMPDEAPAKLRFREPMHFLTEVKDLWRDKGIHPVEDFSPERSERVYNSIQSFMQTCAEKGIAEPNEDLA